MSKPPAAEFLHAGLARYDEPADDNRDGEERYDSVESPAVELNVAVDAFCIRIECVGVLDDGGDKGDEREHDKDACAWESVMDDWMPACVGMAGSDDALSKEEVDDKEQDHTRSDEYIGRNGYSDVMGVDGPCNADARSDDS